MATTVFLLIISFQLPFEDWSRLDSLEQTMALWDNIIYDDIVNYDIAEDEADIYRDRISRSSNVAPEKMPLFRQPAEIEARIRGYSPAFVRETPHSSTWRGGSESGTCRLTVGWNRWKLYSTIDKDAYEPRWNDLTRYSMEYRDERRQVLAGDWTMSFARGLTFWNKPTFGSTAGFAAASGIKDFRLSPATNTSVNNALRGLAGLWNWDSWQVLAITAKTQYDATIDNEGNLLKISDGGYHRSAGEELKRGTLGETLIGTGLNYRYSTESAKFAFGALSWFAGYSPELQPATSRSDPFPLKGNKAGATGLTLSGEWKNSHAGLEVTRDNNGTGACAVQATHRIEKSKSRIKVSGAVIPAEFINPHAAEIGSWKAQGFAAWGILIEQPLPWRRFNTILFTTNHFQRDFPVSGDEIARNRWETTTETDGIIYRNYRWNIRFFSRNESSGSIVGNNERLRRLRLSFRKDFLSWGQLGSWIEQANNREETGENYSSQGIGISCRAAISGNRSGSTLFPGSSFPVEARLGLSLFDAENLPVYLGEVSYPDYVRVIRLSGQGVQLSLETILSPFKQGVISCRASRLYPLTAETKGDGEIYLSMTIKI